MTTWTCTHSGGLPFKWRVQKYSPWQQPRFLFLNRSTLVFVWNLNLSSIFPNCHCDIKNLNRKETEPTFGSQCSLHITLNLIIPPAAAAKSLQSCPTLCDPTDGSPPGSSVPGIFQARVLEWVATAFSDPPSRWT